MKKPLVGITLFFTGGIILGRYLFIPPLPLYLTLTSLFCLTLLFYIKGKERWISYLPLFLTLLAGNLYFNYTYFPSSPLHIINFAPSEERMQITGWVIDEPRLRGWKKDRVCFTLRAEKIRFKEEDRKAEGKIWVSSYFPFINYDYGDKVRIKGHLLLPEGAKNKGEFDWQKYLSYQGIWTEIHTGKVELIKRGGGNPLVKWAYKSRHWMIRVTEHTLPQPYSAILKGIMLGDKESLPSEVREYFLRTGTGHILVVSGLHVGLILFILFLLFKSLGLSFKLASLISIPLLGYYALLTGLRAPVVRASLMGTVGLVCLLLDRDVPILVILSLAALIILIFNPLNLFTASFQLSFIAVGGIIYLTPHLEKKVSILPYYLRKSLAVSLAAQLSILPLLAFYFKRLPLIGIVTNLFIAPLMTIVLSLGLLTLLLGTVSIGAAQIIANSNWIALFSLLNIVKFFSFSSSQTLSLIACPEVKLLSPYLLIIYYAILILSPHLPKILKKDTENID
ncbi:MAG: ComEC/Rec2 family competence protein [Candidatus Aerophobetes bacterium]|nr:ComEC/Rec2 family competence protein [Candidatus Aerophobetes bacterium]